MNKRINSLINVYRMKNSITSEASDTEGGKGVGKKKKIEKHCHEGITALIAVDAIDSDGY